MPSKPAPCELRIPSGLSPLSPPACVRQCCAAAGALGTPTVLRPLPLILSRFSAADRCYGCHLTDRRSRRPTESDCEQRGPEAAAAGQRNPGAARVGVRARAGAGARVGTLRPRPRRDPLRLDSATALPHLGCCQPSPRRVLLQLALLGSMEIRVLTSEAITVEQCANRCPWTPLGDRTPVTSSANVSVYETY